MNEDFDSLIYAKPPWGVYCASSYNSVTCSIPDLLGNQPDAIITGPITTKIMPGNGSIAPVYSLEGTTKTSVVWPTGSWPNKFTMCSITRYVSGSSNRLLVAGNHTFGHFNGRGVITYNDPTTQTVANVTLNGRSSTDWLATCGMSNGTIPTNILIDGSACGTSTIPTGPGVNYPLGINYISSSQTSFAFSHVLIWDQELTAVEMKTVSDVLMQYLVDGVELYDRYFYKVAFSDILTTKMPWGIYCASSFTGGSIYNSGEIPDLLNRRNSAICANVTLTASTGNGAGANIPYVTGTTSSSIRWPISSVPTTFTVCSITRYLNAYNQDAILQADNGSWIYGHAVAKKGVVRHNNDAYVTQNILTQNTYSETPLTNWVVVCAKNTGTIPENTVIVDGVQCGVRISDQFTSSAQLYINKSGGSRNSDFAFSHVLIWDQELTDTEMKTVSFVLSKYLSDGIELKTKFYNSIPTLEQAFTNLLATKPPWGVYCASSYVSGQLIDLTGKQGNAVCKGVTSNYSSNGVNGANARIPVISGTTTGNIVWPANSIPTIFTICSITRYSNSNVNTQKRILQGNTVNTLHGHHSEKRGVAHYNGWRTVQTSLGIRTDWLVMCGKNTADLSTSNEYILADGDTIGLSNVIGTISISGGGSELAINAGLYSGESSDFAFSHVLIWDHGLSTVDMRIVNNVLRQYLVDGIELKNKYTFDTRVLLPKYTGINSIFCNILVSKPPLGIYCANTHVLSSGSTTGIIPDLLGGAFQATTSIVTKLTSAVKSNGANASIPYLSGTTTDSIQWPANSIPTKYTICSITRYTNATTTNGIIYAKDYTEWFHGHKNSRGQVFYNNNFMTPAAPNGDDASKIGAATDWLVTCGKTGGSTPTNILLDGVPSGTAIFAGFTDPRTLAINKNSNVSAFGFSHLLVWDQELTDTEMKSVSDVLQQYLYDGIELSNRYAAYLDIATNTNTKKQFESLLYRKPPWGIYCASSYALGKIPDLMGKQSDAVCVYISSSGKTGTNVNGAVAGVPYIAGNTMSTVTFPLGSVPRKFTVCSITRYTGANKLRILSTNGLNWLHGHWGGRRGVAHYDSWVTDQINIDPSTNWLVMCGKSGGASPTNILRDGISCATNAIQLTTNAQMAINQYFLEKSDYAFSHVLIWDQELSDSEMKIVSNVLQQYLKDGVELIENYRDFFNTQYRQNDNAKFVKLVNSKPPLAVYCANSYNSTNQTIPDLYRRLSPAKCTNIISDASNGYAASAVIPYLRGYTTSTIVFPQNSIPIKNTVCSITRYTSMDSTKQKRILTISQTQSVSLHNINSTSITPSSITSYSDDKYNAVFGFNSKDIINNDWLHSITVAPNTNTRCRIKTTIGFEFSTSGGNFSFSVQLTSVTFTIRKVVGFNSETDIQSIIINNKQILYSGTTNNEQISTTSITPNKKVLDSDLVIDLFGYSESSTIYRIYATAANVVIIYTKSLLFNPLKGAIGFNIDNNDGVSSPDWYHGHSDAKRGIANYGDVVLTKLTNDAAVSVGTLTDWLVMCGKIGGTNPTNILVDGAISGDNEITQDTNAVNRRLCINAYTDLQSEFAFSHALIWDQELTDDEMATVSNILRQYLKDGIELNTKFPELFDIQSQFRNLLSYKPPYSIYLASSCASNQIPDLMNKQGNAICANVIIGSTTINTYGANASIRQLTGNTSAKIIWPSGSCPSQFTICSLTRYNASTNQNRIITSATQYVDTTQPYITDFAHGHDSGRIAYAKYGGAARTTSKNTDITNWLVFCGSSQYAPQAHKQCFFADGVDVTNPPATLTVSVGGIQLGINTINTISVYNSDFAFSSMFVWDTILSPNEMITVNRAFQNYLIDGVELSYGIETRPYNMNYNKAGTNVLLRFPSKNIRLPYTGPSNYFTKYTTPSLNMVKTNDSIENQLTPYICGNQVVTNYKINGKDIGNLFQSERLSRACRVYVGISTGLDISNNKNSYPIWIDSAYTNQSVNAETLYFYTVYNSPSALSGCYVKYYIDNTIGYIKINDQTINVDLADKYISSGSMAVSNDASNKFSLTQGPNYISIKAINNQGPGYVQVDFYDSTNKFLFGTNADTWYASRKEYTTNIP
jgi:hypothetical protein